jgi:hypothetical protein
MHLELSHHPAMPPSQPLRVWATVDHAAAFGAMATTNIWFGVAAPTSRFAMPRSDEPSRTDGLWQTTCFEAFLRQQGDERYREWNFAPSGDWAAYDFSAYRKGMEQADIGAPYIRLEDNFTWFALGATIAVEADAQWDFGASVVLEEADGAKSYWALAHPAEKPDFHHPDCFAAKLA